MTQAEFRKRGWLQHFTHYGEVELATVVMCIASLVEMGCWSDLVRYCVYTIEECQDEQLMEEVDTETLH